ncbi:MAG: hypothetical protein AAGU11_06250 [Syntrophobacteraceae bacterium]
MRRKKGQAPEGTPETKGVKPVLSVDFSQRVFLLEEIAKRAEAQLRSPENQVLWELSQCIKGVADGNQ